MIVLLILVALAFDFMNGFHDAANSIATVVSTRVLTPRMAVAWAAFFNFVAAFGFGVAVATTVGKGIVAPEVVDHAVIFAALVAAFLWDLITWHYGLPSSSSHALIAGLAGAGVAKAGVGVLVPAGLVKVVVFIVVSPLVGFLLGALFMVVIIRLVHRASPFTIDRAFRRAQLASAAGYSLGHGTNDAQKTMGIIAALLYASIWRPQQEAFNAGKTEFPFWIVLVCHLAIGLGTMAGGWRIVKTMGMRITKLRPFDGACAELAAATSLFTSASLGIPVSTTHTITGAIVGVGAVQRLSALRWGVARQVIWAWVLTIPCSAIVAAGVYEILRLLG